MLQDSDYNDVPFAFLHCIYSQCIHANNCLRFKIMKHVTPDNLAISIINPSRIQENGECCEYFLEDRKVRFAIGITHLYDELPYNKAKEIKKEILSYFQRNTYYRIRNKERLISPSDQEFIRRLYRDKGINEEPFFDDYVEKYDWPRQ